MNRRTTLGGRNGAPVAIQTDDRYLRSACRGHIYARRPSGTEFTSAEDRASNDRKVNRPFSRFLGPGRGEGQLVFNNLALRLHSALDGLSVAYMPEDQVLPYVADGRLVRALEDWCPPFPGYHLYYPSRRHSSPPLALLVDALRYRD